MQNPCGAPSVRLNHGLAAPKRTDVGEQPPPIFTPAGRPRRGMCDLIRGSVQNTSTATPSTTSASNKPPPDGDLPLRPAPTRLQEFVSRDGQAARVRTRHRHLT